MSNWTYQKTIQKHDVFMFCFVFHVTSVYQIYHVSENGYHHACVAILDILREVDDLLNIHILKRVVHPGLVHRLEADES